MSALPSSSTHTYGTRGKDDPWVSQPTLDVYSALGSVFNALKPALAKTAALPTDPAARLKLAQLIVNGNDKLCAATGDSRVAANNDFMSFRRALSHLLHELHPETYLKYRWKWDWLTAVPYDHLFFGFREAVSTLVLPDTVPAPPPPPPTPKKFVPPQAPPVAGPSKPTRPSVVPPRTIPVVKPPQNPADMEGQETSVDDEGNQLPCPNSFQEYLLPSKQRSFSVSARPKSVLVLSHLLPPFSLKPWSNVKQKQKTDTHPKVKPPQHLPIYDKGPLFKQGYLLAELQAPLLEGYAPPDWVRPPCGSCAALGIVCTSGNFLHGVWCDNCNNQKKLCGFDLSIPRMTSLLALCAAANAAPERISSLIVDSLLLRGMTRVAFALAEDQYKLLEAKLGTLSLILSRVYSDEGDTGLHQYFHDVKALQSLLEFLRHVPLDTPMLYPCRTSTLTMGVTKDKYTWTMTFDEEEVNEYLSSLRKELRQKSSPLDKRSSEIAEGSDPTVIKPAEITLTPAPDHLGSLFGSPSLWSLGSDAASSSSRLSPPLRSTVMMLAWLPSSPPLPLPPQAINPLISASIH
ncbi:hypothetical protein H1R20_g4508, partial [Candolleomyces eurysporus]